MTPKEEYDLKRKNFINATKANFAFLVSEFGYDQPKISEGIQPNGTVITDEFLFQNSSRDRIIRISNDYHPVDYGFEIQFYTLKSWENRRLTNERLAIQNKERVLALYKLKEEQDVEQSYVEVAADELRLKFAKQISGESWF